MKGKAMTDYPKTGVPWRVAGWGVAAGLLAFPFVAMRFTSEVQWSAGDFIFMGALFAIVGGALEFAVRASADWHYRAGAALALLATFLVIWANLAVGIVGSEGNPANLLFFGALLVGLIGACIVRFRASGMALAAFATAISLWIAFGMALTQPTDEPFVGHSIEFAGISIVAALFLGSAALFHRAGRQSSSSS
jgi:hypothetical protein